MLSLILRLQLRFFAAWTICHIFISVTRGRRWPFCTFYFTLFYLILTEFELELELSFKRATKWDSSGQFKKSALVSFLTETGQLNMWSSWGVCSATCGGGQQQKTRAHGNEEIAENRSCNTQSCFGNSSSLWRCCANSKHISHTLIPFSLVIKSLVF